jgi:hypothetical protein
MAIAVLRERMTPSRVRKADGVAPWMSSSEASMCRSLTIIVERYDLVPHHSIGPTPAQPVAVAPMRAVSGVAVDRRGQWPAQGRATSRRR